MSRENEGDLIIAAEDLTPAKMAFMIRYTSGLICTPISTAIAKQLDLPQMVEKNTESHGTAYTVSIDADLPGMTTGISSEDRSRTCVQLADPNAKSTDFRRPGHVFPLRAVDGGVLERTGHTEAAVDLCKLTGKHPVGAVCELIIDGDLFVTNGRKKPEFSGSRMMRRDDCLAFGKEWGLKVCTIEDLAAYIAKQKQKQ
jgi:3,4-dihydroxy 2-butanone 4-phosphate synthase